MGLGLEIGLALSKIDLGEDFRDAVTPGSYTIDALVRVRASMSVGPEQMRAVPAAVPWQRLCALALSKLNGVTMESLVEEALRLNGTLEGPAQEASERAKAAVEAIVGSTRRPVRGNVKLTDVVIEEVRS